MTTSMTWSNDKPWQSVENNPRVSEHEVVFCDLCHDEAVVLSLDGLCGLCAKHFQVLSEAANDGD